MRAGSPNGDHPSFSYVTSMSTCRLASLICWRVLGFGMCCHKSWCFNKIRCWYFIPWNGPRFGDGFCNPCVGPLLLLLQCHRAPQLSINCELCNVLNRVVVCQLEFHRLKRKRASEIIELEASLGLTLNGTPSLSWVIARSRFRFGHWF